METSARKLLEDLESELENQPLRAQVAVRKALRLAVLLEQQEYIAYFQLQLRGANAPSGSVEYEWLHNRRKGLRWDPVEAFKLDRQSPIEGKTNALPLTDLEHAYKSVTRALEELKSLSVYEQEARRELESTALATLEEVRRYLMRIERRLSIFVVDSVEVLSGGQPDSRVALPSPLSRAIQICERFHYAASRLRLRSHDRAPLVIQDEHDVQYLLAALLAIEFDDIRPEETTPSHGGGSSRIDFLLKSEGIGIEVKKVRAGLGDRSIADELILDVERYRAHPSCENLICLVYDPGSVLRNPEGLTRDLRRRANEDFEVIVIVSP